MWNQIKDNQWELVCRTDKVSNTGELFNSASVSAALKPCVVCCCCAVTPVWPAFVVNTGLLCHEDLTRPMLFRLYDWSWLAFFLGL